MICNGEIDMYVDQWTHASVETRCKPRGSHPSSVELQDAAVDRMAMLSQFSKDNNGIFLKENLLFPLEEKKPLQIGCWESNFRWYNTSKTIW